MKKLDTYTITIKNESKGKVVYDTYLLVDDIHKVAKKIFNTLLDMAKAQDIEEYK